MLIVVYALGLIMPPFLGGLLGVAYLEAARTNRRWRPVWVIAAATSLVTAGSSALWFLDHYALHAALTGAGILVVVGGTLWEYRLGRTPARAGLHRER